ncbi:MAG: Ig-like domain-containing protein [Marinobacter sp.]|nr:Ig-like domain-containing protein [Marinobacter sp.]
MKTKKILALAPVFALLVACEADDLQNMQRGPVNAALIYSYPADEQAEVPPKADLILRFSLPIADDELAEKLVLREQHTGTPVPYELRAVDDGHSLVLAPHAELEPGTGYEIIFDAPLLASNGELVANPNANYSAEPGIQFTTRAALSGVLALDSLASEFEVVDMLPAPDSFFQPMDFSTFLFRTSQPIHPDSVVYGETISLTDSAGALVPANVLVKGRYLTLDPCTAPDPRDCGSQQDRLDANQHYTLALDGISNLHGDTLSFSRSFQPRNTGPSVILFQEAVDANFSQQSVLNGQLVNAVTLNSVLQGVAGPSQQTGGLYAELAYAPSFPGDDPVPLRIARGSVLSSTSLDVKIGGSVPIIASDSDQIQGTGEIKVTMISDAVGYLYPNPYSRASTAPRHVKLIMDVAMNTAEAQPNASLSQNLLRVELTGLAIVTNGVLTIDAIGMVEPNLLGQEFTDATIAFRIEADTNAAVQRNALANRPVDLQGPQLQSWVPGPADATPPTRQAMQRPGNPIVLNFDEPLDQDTLQQGFVLRANGEPLANQQLRRQLDGTVVTLNPIGGLQHGTDYELDITSALTDLVGNPAMPETLSFSLPAIAGNGAVQRSPIALTVYPGFPCATTGTVSFANNEQGRCLDSAPSGTSRDTLPIPAMPEDRPVMVVFSQSMDLDSIRISGDTPTLVVERMSNETTVAEVVSGRLEKNHQQIRFFPDQPWLDGSFYRLRLRSASGSQCSTSTICGANGLPLKTDLLVNPEANGGPDLVIYFRGAPRTNTVFTPLRNLPIRDTNANYVIDCHSPGASDCLEPFNHQPDPANPGQFLPAENSARLEVVNGQATVAGMPANANVGCPPGNSCPENKFIYQTYALNTEIVGTVTLDDGEEAIRVLLYPTLLATTSASVFLDGLGESATGPQVLRMRYAMSDSGRRDGLLEGLIRTGDDGRPEFSAVAPLLLDAPNLAMPIEGALGHNLYSLPLELDLSGPIVFLDDGRMQVVQYNRNAPALNASISITIPLIGPILDCLLNPANCLSGEQTSTVQIPLVIPVGGVYLNFISFPVKNLPEEG